MLIPIERKAREPVAAQIVEYLRRAIEAGRLEPGREARADPRAREGARPEPRDGRGRVSRARGAGAHRGHRRPRHVRARRRASRVARASAPHPRTSCPFEPVFSRATEAARASRVARVDYTAPAGAVRFERLIPDASLYPHEAFRQALNRALAKGGPALYDYGDPRGHEGLRRALVERMARSGIEADADDVVITAGATQGFAIAARVFCDAGDAVAVESPTYPGRVTTLTSLGMRAAPVPIASDGLDLDRLDADARARRRAAASTPCRASTIRRAPRPRSRTASACSRSPGATACRSSKTTSRRTCACAAAARRRCARSTGEGSSRISARSRRRSSPPRAWAGCSRRARSRRRRC